MTNRKDLCKLAEALNGLPVLGCRPDSPAHPAGVVYGDILLTVNGRPTPNWAAFIEARSLSATEMSVEVFRNGTQIAMSVPLHGNHRFDPAQLLAELIAERLVPFELTPPPVPSKPN